MHDALAVHGGHGGDADVDRAGRASVDADAAVLRQAPLGDVELRHDLDARGDRGLRARAAASRGRTARRRCGSGRGARPRTARCGCPRRSRVDRVLDQEVDQPDHRRLERHVAEVVDVLLAVALAVGRPPIPSTIFWSAVVEPRRTCARWPRGWPRAAPRRDARSRPGSGGGRRAARGWRDRRSASVTAPPSTDTGHATYCRRYFGERFFIDGQRGRQLLAGEERQAHLHGERPQHVVRSPRAWR